MSKLSRRSFVVTSAWWSACTGASLASAAEVAPASGSGSGGSALELPKLPWEANALDPVISANTIGFHHGKHHRSYFDALSKLLPGTPLEGRSLDVVVKEVAGKPDKQAIFNNAAQAWNHTFYWHSLSPKGGGKPGAELLTKIDAAFGSFAEFQKSFLAASAGQFGSGWVWLTWDKSAKKINLVKTGNAETPLTNPNTVPLAVLDVWEHAYYLDYQNRRADYATAVLDKLMNWRFVEENLSKV